MNANAHDTADRELAITRLLDAPRELRHGRFPRRQARQDRPPGGIGEGGKRQVETVGLRHSI